MKELSDVYIYGLYTCNLLGSILNRVEPNTAPQSINLEMLYNFQSSHNVSCATYLALKEIYKEEEIKAFELDYKKNLVRITRFEVAGQKVYDAFEQEKIPYIILKGAVLKDLYLSPGLRYFTDYDLYIEKSRCNDVKNVMDHLGFQYDGDTENDMDFQKHPSLHFEMHYSLFTRKYDFNGYFNEPFKKAVLLEGYSYGHVLKKDNCFIYVIAHLYKHYTDGGCGIKLFLDIYVMMQKWTLDMDYICKELKKLGLDGFLEKIIKLNAFLFDGAEADEDLKQIADYVFNNGTFGNVKNSMALEYAQNNEKEKRRFGIYKIRFFAKRWQLSFSGMRKQYPILSSIPCLLPICYLHKLARVIFFRKGILKTQVRDINNFSNDYSNYIEHILKISNIKSKKS